MREEAPVKPKDVMTMEETCAYLAMDRPTLTSLVRERRIPCLESNGAWLFSKKSLDKWRSLRDKRRS